jgi:hypothetical protein
MYKILDTDSNTHVIFDSYIDACAFKGLDPKKAYKVKRNTKDRTKHFRPYTTSTTTASYVSAWLSDNKLRA